MLKFFGAIQRIFISNDYNTPKSSILGK